MTGQEYAARLNFFKSAVELYSSRVHGTSFYTVSPVTDSWIEVRHIFNGKLEGTRVRIKKTSTEESLLDLAKKCVDEEKFRYQSGKAV